MKNSIDKRFVLVTGGAGYIGSHVCKALSISGLQPIVYDDLSTGNRSFVKWGPLVEGNILDRDRLRSVFEEYQISSVFHFAAASIVSRSVVSPNECFLTNIAGTLSLLDAMLQANCFDLVFSSSCAVYGIPSVVPISEDAPRVPINPYGHSKAAIEDILNFYRSAHGIRAMVLRYFNAAGADPDCEIGESRDLETHLIPLAIAALFDPKRKFTIYGNDYETPDGTAVRDYVHVTDIAAAHVLALRLLGQGFVGGPFNLGTGAGYSVKEIVSMISEVSGKRVAVTFSDRRAGDPPVLIADPASSRKSLGFNCSHSSLSEIIGTAFRWHQKNFHVHS